MESLANLPAAACDLTQFLRGLLESGDAFVSSAPLNANTNEAIAVLRQLDERAREELSLDAPAFSPEAALWAARLTYHFAQFTVCRDVGQERIDAVCRGPCPAPISGETIWSVDLTLRHMPTLFRLAKHLSGGDPLVLQMQRIGREWPLSSVGIPGIEGVETAVLMQSPALARIYADRIFDEGDLARLGDPAVDDLLRRDLGLHRELAPTIARKLFVPTNEGN